MNVLPSMKTLVNTAVGTAVVGIGAILYVQLKRMEQIANSDFFREAFKLLRAHPGAVRHLGEPIKQLGYKINDPDNFMTTDKAQFQVNVKGPNDKGKLFLWAKPTDGVWNVSRIELEINNVPGKRMVIKDGPIHANNNTETASTVESASSITK